MFACCTQQYPTQSNYLLIFVIFFFIYLFCVHQIYLEKKYIYCNLLDYQIMSIFLVVNKLKNKISKQEFSTEFFIYWIENIKSWFFPNEGSYGRGIFWNLRLRNLTIESLTVLKSCASCQFRCRILRWRKSE